ncbi:MAG: hypothetical protein LBL67_02005 [Coriobacteriales bacterium]|nr:hypothetical protein [Coriobacteriales bacterium]
MTQVKSKVLGIVLSIGLASSMLFLAAPPKAAHAANPTVATPITLKVAEALSLTGGDTSAIDFGTLTPAGSTLKVGTKTGAEMQVVSNATAGYKLTASGETLTGALPQTGTKNSIATTATGKVAGASKALSAASLEKNTWGIALSDKRTTASQTAEFTGDWLAPTSAGIELANTSAPAGVNGDFYTIGYGAAIDGSQPHDTYTTRVTYTLVANS